MEPYGWNLVQPLDVGEPVHLAIFLDAGCFADLVQRARALRTAGTTVVTSGRGAYACMAADGRVDTRPDMLFDSLRAITATAIADPV
jgi:hypothetical protein